MKIAFFGLYESFDYYRIGGTDSIARRLAVELRARGEQVEFVHFGAPTCREETAPESIALRYYQAFDESLKALANQCDHIITIYVPPKYHLAYARFRWKTKSRARFHFLYSVWPSSRAKRRLLSAELRIAPYNGHLLCISPRLCRSVSQWADRAMLLLPPVPQNYFLTPEEKPVADRLRITYVGRLDPGKGAREAFSFFKYLRHHRPTIQTRICGYPWAHRAETMRLHQELAAQDVVEFEPTEVGRYSSIADTNVRRILRQTDVLFLPYKKLNSTIDTPLLILEGMASLCVVITRPLGDLPELYGTEAFMLQDMLDYSGLLKMLVSLQERIAFERQRLAQRVLTQRFSTREVVDKLLEVLSTVPGGENNGG